MVKVAKSTAAKKVPDIEVPLRVTLVRPPEGVQFSLGRTDDGEAHEKKLSRGRDVSFELTLRGRGGSGATPIRMLGEHVHGTPTARFIPIGVGTLAGQADSCWTRVVKISLAGITPKLVRELQRTPGARLEARVQGTDKRGAPACASVPLLGGGWRVVS